MPEITFKFNLDKLISALAFFASAGVRDLTKLKAAKLLYFADKEHLLTQGAPILGDVYWCMDYGPVPSYSCMEMDVAIDRPEVQVETTDLRAFDRVLKVRRPLFGGYARFENKVQPDTSMLTASELSVLKLIVANYGRMTARALVDLTHEEPTWKIPNEQRTKAGRTREPIPYELFFEGAPASAQIFLAKLKAEQCGEVIPLPGDAEMGQFAGELLSYSFEPSFDLDRDHERRLTAR